MTSVRGHCLAAAGLPTLHMCLAGVMSLMYLGLVDWDPMCPGNAPGVDHLAAAHSTISAVGSKWPYSDDKPVPLGLEGMQIIWAMPRTECNFNCTSQCTEQRTSNAPPLMHPCIMP